MPQTEELTDEEMTRLEQLAASGTDADRARVAAALAGGAEDEGQPKRRRGRPPGSKNRPKDGSVPPDGASAGAGASGAAPSPARNTRGAKVGREVGQQIAAGGMMLSLVDSHCGLILAQNGPALGDAYGKLADKNARVLAIMEGMINGGVYAEVIVVTLAVLVPIMAHHGLAPEGMAQTFAGRPAGPQGNPPTQQHTHAPPPFAGVPTGDTPTQNGYAE